MVFARTRFFEEINAYGFFHMTKMDNVYCFFVFGLFWKFSCVREVQKMWTNVWLHLPILSHFGANFSMFQMKSRLFSSRTWQNGTGMKSKCKMKLNICSCFYTSHTNQKIWKETKNEKTIWHVLQTKNLKTNSYFFFCCFIAFFV